MNVLRMRKWVEVLTDPQRRVYDGCMFSSERRWSEWTVLHSDVPLEKVEPWLAYWRDLNAYAVSERGEVNTRCEFEVVEEPPV